MFDQLVESAVSRKQDKRGKFFVITSAAWLLSFSLLLVGGIFAYEAKLNDEFASIISMVAPPPPPLHKGTPEHGQRPTPKQQTTGYVSASKPPTDIAPPNPHPPVIDINPIGDGNSNPSGGPGSGNGPGSPDGVDGGLPPSATVITEPPPRPRETPKPVVEETPKPAPKQEIIRSQLLQGLAIRRVQPSYPPMAKAAGIQGRVVIEVLIDEAGNVASVRALSGHPILREAALSAAHSWKWNPTLLNQKPVKVIGTITFNFTR